MVLGPGSRGLRHVAVSVGPVGKAYDWMGIHPESSTARPSDAAYHLSDRALGRGASA